MKRKVTALVAAFLCLLSMVGSGVTSKAEVIHETELENYIMKEMSAAHVLGMSVSIVSPDKELYCAAYGAAQKTESDYVLGALTKSLTAAGIMHLVEDSEIKLDDTVSDYLPDYKNVGNITIQELLNETSGIASTETMSNLTGKGKKGTYEASNANYNLLGEIIEKASGENYEEYISDNILDPLEMSSTYSLRHDPQMGEELLTGYQNYFGFPFSSQYKYSKDEDWIQVPSGYMISDCKDMGKYLQMYLKEGGDILSKDSVESMLYKGAEVSKEETKGLFKGTENAGMGWIAKEVDGNKIVYQLGQVKNYSTAMILLPQKNLGITMMFNSADSIVGQKLINKLIEGVVLVELEKTPGTISSNSYFLGHGVADGIMLLAILLAWMPIFLMGVWSKLRRNHLKNPLGIGIDVCIHLVLPTVILLLVPHFVPFFQLKYYAPDVFYVICAVVATLYLGAVVKLIATVVFTVLGKKEPEEVEKTEEAEADKKEEEKPKEAESDKKEEEKPKEAESDKKEEEKPEKAESDKKEEEKPEKAESDKKEEEKPKEAESDKKTEEKTKEPEVDKDAQ